MGCLFANKHKSKQTMFQILNSKIIEKLVRSYSPSWRFESKKLEAFNWIKVIMRFIMFQEGHYGMYWKITA